MHVACFYLHYNTPDCAGSARAHSVLHHLAQRHTVTLFTSATWRERRITDRFDWVPPGVALQTVEVPYANAMTTAERLRAYLSFPGRALAGSLALHDLDVIYGISTPLTTVAAAAVAARWHGVPWILEVRDLWPDFPVQMGAIPSVPLRRALYRLEQWLYQDAHHVVAVSPDMARHVRSHLAPTHAHSRGRVSTLLPGTDQHLLAHAMERSPETLRQHHGIEARNVVLYAGTFGRANDLPTLLDAARRFRERDIAFLFVGHGYYEPAVRRAADRLSHVFVLPPQPHHRMLSWFALADLALVSFIDLPVLATNAPAKFFDSLSAGTPVIVTNPGWTKSFVEKHRCGWYVPASRPALLADQIATLVSNKARLQAAGDRGARIAQRRFARSDYAEGVTALLESAAEGRS